MSGKSPAFTVDVSTKGTSVPVYQSKFFHLRGPAPLQNVNVASSDAPGGEEGPSPREAAPPQPRTAPGGARAKAQNVFDKQELAATGSSPNGSERKHPKGGTG